MNKKGGGDAGEGGHRGPKGKQIDYREGHFASANLEGQEIVAEACLRRGGEHEENHQRAVEHGESGVAFRRAAESGKKRNLRRGPDEVHAHEQRENHSENNATQCEP